MVRARSATIRPRVQAGAPAHACVTIPRPSSPRGRARRSGKCMQAAAIFNVHFAFPALLPPHSCANLTPRSAQFALNALAPCLLHFRAIPASLYFGRILAVFLAPCLLYFRCAFVLRLCFSPTHIEMTPVEFEPTPFRTGALSQRLRPLGQSVLLLRSMGCSDFISNR